MENNPPFEKELGGVFKQFPALPDNAKEILVQIAPWLCLILAVFGALGLMAAAGATVMFSVSDIGRSSYGSAGQMWISLIILAIMVVISLLAFTPLRNRQVKGWNWLYILILLGCLHSLISMSIIGLFITFLVGFWLLFQTKEKYS